MLSKVSIVVITYNALADLKECLHSLENQNYNDIELIVVNDASTDGTYGFLENFKIQSKRKANVITNSLNLGVAGARNVGIQNATGDIIAFTDADCVVDPNWTTELVRCYGHKGVVAVGGIIFDKFVTNIWELSEKGRDFVATEEGYVSYIQGCNMSFATDVLRKFMFNDDIKYGYEEKLLCDILVNENYKLYYTPKAVVYHKHRSDFVSLMRRKYLLGVSSIWYRKKQQKLFMFKRHIIFLFALCLLPLFLINYYFLLLFLALFLVFLLSILRDEIIFDVKSSKEIIITYPFLVLIEFSHFWGSIVGLLKFRLLERY